MATQCGLKSIQDIIVRGSPIFDYIYIFFGLLQPANRIACTVHSLS